jgi:hypothetical protein
MAAYSSKGERELLTVCRYIDKQQSSVNPGASPDFNTWAFSLLV